MALPESNQPVSTAAPQTTFNDGLPEFNNVLRTQGVGLFDTRSEQVNRPEALEVLTDSYRQQYLGRIEDAGVRAQLGKDLKALPTALPFQVDTASQLIDPLTGEFSEIGNQFGPFIDRGARELFAGALQADQIARLQKQSGASRPRDLTIGVGLARAYIDSVQNAPYARDLGLTHGTRLINEVLNGIREAPVSEEQLPRLEALQTRRTQAAEAGDEASVLAVEKEIQGELGLFGSLGRAFAGGALQGNIVTSLANITADIDSLDGQTEAGWALQLSEAIDGKAVSLQEGSQLDQDSFAYAVANGAGYYGSLLVGAPLAIGVRASRLGVGWLARLASTGKNRASEVAAEKLVTDGTLKAARGFAAGSAAAAGGASQGHDYIDTVRGRGEEATAGQYAAALGFGTALGLTDAIIPAGQLTRGALQGAGAVRRISRDAAGEAVQEVAQNIFSDGYARLAYDQERDVFDLERLVVAGGAGATIAGTAGALIFGLGKATRRFGKDIEGGDPADISDSPVEDSGDGTFVDTTGTEAAAAPALTPEQVANAEQAELEGRRGQFPDLFVEEGDAAARQIADDLVRYAPAAVRDLDLAKKRVRTLANNLTDTQANNIISSLDDPLFWQGFFNSVAQTQGDGFADVSTTVARGTDAALRAQENPVSGALGGLEKAINLDPDNQSLYEEMMFRVVAAAERVPRYRQLHVLSNETNRTGNADELQASSSLALADGDQRQINSPNDRFRDRAIESARTATRTTDEFFTSPSFHIKNLERLGITDNKTLKLASTNRNIIPSIAKAYESGGFVAAEQRIGEISRQMRWSDDQRKVWRDYQSEIQRNRENARTETRADTRQPLQDPSDTAPTTSPVTDAELITPRVNTLRDGTPYPQGRRDEAELFDPEARPDEEVLNGKTVNIEVPRAPDVPDRTRDLVNPDPARVVDLNALTDAEVEAISSADETDLERDPLTGDPDTTMTSDAVLPLPGNRVLRGRRGERVRRNRCNKES